MKTVNNQIPKKWHKFKLGKLLKIIHGYAFKGENFKDEGNHLLLTPGNFYEKGGLKITKKETFCKGNIPRDYILENEDLIIAMTDLKQTAPILGSAAFINKNNYFLHNQRLGKVSIFKKEILLKEYCYFLFNSYSLREFIKLTASGATVKHTSPKRIYQAEVLIPDVKAQEKIVSILSAFDELIEKNRRRIEILEEMAQLLYREWFVEFRFPSYEKVKMVNSELGKIPERWKIKPVKNVLEKYIGGGWGKEEKNNKFPVDAYVIRGTDIPRAKKGDFSECPFRNHKKSNFLNRQLFVGDIVFEVSGGSEGQPLGRSLLVNQELLSSFSKPVIPASFCKLIRSNKLVSFEYLYCLLNYWYKSGELGVYQVQSTGISNYHFEAFIKNVTLIIPDVETLKKFSKITKIIYSEIQQLGRINNILKEVQNIILPKLMSGEIEVN